MKIAIYYPWIYLKSGIERTILETIKRSHHEYTIFTNHYDKEGTYPEFKKLEVIELKKIPVRRNIFSTLKAAIIICTQKVNLSDFDKLVIHSEGLGDLFLLRNNTLPTFCFCHTPLRPVFDLEYKKREMIKRNMFQKPAYLIFNFIFQTVDKLLWMRYEYILFNSAETLKRAKRGGLVTKNTNYSVLHPGVNWEQIKPSWTYKKYFLVPGRIMWTKNVELAIKAFKIFYQKRKDFRLIIAGQVDNKSRSYVQELKKLSSGSTNIDFVENPNNNKMLKLYSECYLGIFTAFNEDWGITPIEANAYGKAAISVNRGGFKESQISGTTGFLTDPTPTAIANKMIIFAKDGSLTKKIGRLARNNSKMYSWKYFIAKLDKTFQEY